MIAQGTGNRSGSQVTGSDLHLPQARTAKRCLPLMHVTPLGVRTFFPWGRRLLHNTVTDMCLSKEWAGEADVWGGPGALPGWGYIRGMTSFGLPVRMLMSRCLDLACQHC
ncbi:hypothetical protein KIL84_004475 [Mauremys mutica]|uniref:Uncharacterized protein n=1 Tax=Mauremys mutica TaxID=74926 RepID=A0A9D4B6C7_9SAUR|nr:hypothetical protein KIL84_004475 [Mauremys mutica]